MSRSDIGRFAMVPLWVIKRCDAQAIAVYAALGIWANDAGEAWPSVARMGSDLNLSENTVREALKRLSSEGAVVVKPRYKADGGRTSNMMVLRYANPHIEHEGAELPPSKSEGGAHQSVRGAPSNSEEELKPPNKTNPLKGDNSQRSPQKIQEDALGLTREIAALIDKVPLFEQYWPAERHLLDPLIREMIPHAPSAADMIGEVHKFVVFYQNPSGKAKKRKSPTGCLRAWFASRIGGWSVIISRKGGLTAQSEILAGGVSVIDSRASLIESAKAELGRKVANGNG